MWNLQNLGYTAHKMQVSQIELHEIRQQANRKGNDVYSTLVLGLHTWYTGLAYSVWVLELVINLCLMFIYQQMALKMQALPAHFYPILSFVWLIVLFTNIWFQNWPIDMLCQ